jgi:hypothetical protein
MLLMWDMFIIIKIFREDVKGFAIYNLSQDIFVGLKIPVLYSTSSI